MKFATYTILSLIALLLFSIPFGGHDLAFGFVKKAIFQLSFSDVWTNEDVGTRYRSFETFKTFSTYMSYPFSNMVFGGGFGSLVNLDTSVLLGAREYETIPWLHNGYLYSLIKAGLIGSVSYLIFMVKAYLGAFRCNDLIGKNLIKATVIGLLITNIVICGFFSNESVFAYIVLGYFSGFCAQKTNWE
jgi:hypothetical protein